MALEQGIDYPALSPDGRRIGDDDYGIKQNWEGALFHFTLAFLYLSDRRASTFGSDPDDRTIHPSSG